MTRHRSAPAVGLALGLLVAGCTNPFQPARPQFPSATAVRENFTDPDSLLNTMGLALVARSGGQNAYSDALADSTSATTADFYAFYDPTVADAWKATSHRDPTNPWNARLEGLLFSWLVTLRNPDWVYAMQWAPDPTSPSDQRDDAAGTAFYHRHYVLTATQPGQDASILAVGYADLTFIRVSPGHWALRLWQDRLDPQFGVNPTLTDEVSMSRRRLDMPSQ